MTGSASARRTTRPAPAPPPPAWPQLGGPEAWLGVTKPVGITVYSCEQDEADLFNHLSPRHGLLPTITGAPASETIIAAPSNRCVSVGHKSALSERTLLALKKTGVEYISTRSIGVDHIDLQAAAALGLTVSNVEYSPEGVADYTLMLMLMALRHAKAIVSSAQRFDFRLNAARGKELRDLTVGVLGVGRIGQAVIERLRGFGCRVLAYSRSRSVPAAADYAPLNHLLRQSDIVTLHLPLTRDTHHLIAREQLALMKPSALLINTGRGALVETTALVAALESGELGGAALDVLEGEEGVFYLDCIGRQIDNHCLLRLQLLPNVILTPHTAYHTGRALYDSVEQTIRNCLAFERSRMNEQN